MAYISEFRHLYNALSQQSTELELSSLLDNWPRQNAPLMKDLAGHRQFDPTYNFDRDNDLQSLYALSRVNDILLLSFRGAEPFTSISESIYSSFWKTLGLSDFYPHQYHPFWCEIVEAEESLETEAAPEVIEWIWPGLTFGDLLFSRAGVHVRGGANFFDAKIAATSTLYDVFRRLNRRTQDLSRDWGHNSQWRTDFRRDYIYNDYFLFNVDARPNFNQPPFLQNFDWNALPQRQFFARENRYEYPLTLEEREELLIHRSFVKCAKDDDDLWPYDDCFLIHRDLPLW